MNHYVPLNYEEINVAAGAYFPSQIKPENNETFILWERALFQRACSTMEIKVPEELDTHKPLLYYCLFRFGFCGAGTSDKTGIWFNPGTIGGQLNFYYEPTEFFLINQRAKELGLKTTQYNVQDVTMKGKKGYNIGKDVVILRMTPDYNGVWDIIAYYAEKLAVLDVAINTNIINSKFAYIVGAKNKAAAEVLKKLFDKVSKGEPAVFFDKRLANDGTDKEEPWQALFRDNIKNSYIVTDLLRDFQTVINAFDTEIGIPTLPYEKKERMVTDEAQSKMADAFSRSVIWFETLKDSFDNANKFFGIANGFNVKLRYKEGGLSNGNSENNLAGDAQMDENE